MCRILHKGVICSKNCYRKMNLVANGLHWGRSKIRSHLLYGKWIRITEEMERKGEDTERGSTFVFILCSCVFMWVLCATVNVWRSGKPLGPALTLHLA